MNTLKVDGLPLAKLKQDFVVIILKTKREFEQLLDNAKEPIFADEQKTYFIRNKACFVFFHNEKSFIKRGAQNDKPVE